MKEKELQIEKYSIIIAFVIITCAIDNSYCTEQWLTLQWNLR